MEQDVNTSPEAIMANWDKQYNPTAPEANFIGPQTDAESVARDNEEQSKPFLDQVTTGIKAGFRGLAASSLWDWGARASIEPDPDFNLDTWKGSLTQGLPLEYHHSFDGVRSLQEASMLRGEIESDLHDREVVSHQGAIGYGSYMLGGIVDLDAPITILSGGAYGEAKLGTKLAAAGIQSQRLAKTIETAGIGAAAGTFDAGIRASTSPTGEWTDLPNAALQGLVFGAATGAVLPHDRLETKLNDNASALREDFHESVADGQTGQKNWTASSVDDGVFNTEVHAETVKEQADLETQMVDLEKQHDTLPEADPKRADIQAQMLELSKQRMAELGFGDGSIGAAEVGSNKPKFNANLAPEDVAMKKAAILHNAANGLGLASDTAFNVRTSTGRAAQKMHDMIGKTLWASDFDRLFNSPSPMGPALAYKLLESPVGIVRNNKSASMLHDIYLSNITHDVNTNYESAFKKWLGERKSTVPDGEAMKTPDLRLQFNREFKAEMDSRYHDAGSHPDSTAAIKEFADHADNASARAQEILKGREGETPVRGAENLKATSGYWPQRWSGENLSRMMKDLADKGLGNPRKLIEDTLSKAYQDLHKWDKDIADKVAKGVTRRAIAKERGIDTNVKRLLDQEGTEYATQFFTDMGIPLKQAEELVKGLADKKLDAKKESLLKARNDIDGRTEIPGTKYTLSDLMDNDVLRVWTSYSRQASGAAALARHGIQKADWKNIVKAIKNDEIGQTGKQHIPDEFYDGIYSHFSGGPIAGGLNPWIRRANQLTNLSLLNNLGLTQLAETGVNMAALGIKIFTQTASKELQELFKGKAPNQAMRELSHWLAPIDGEHMAIRDDLMLDSIRNTPGHYSELGDFLDKIGQKGQRVQGYITGFYYVKQLQQRIAIRGMMHKLGEMYQNGKLISENRLRDMGLDEKTATRIEKYFKDGTIEYEKDGSIKALNPEKWNPSDFEDFVAVLNRYTNQVVQRAMKGEDSVWMHRDVGAMLMHLKNFTMLSMQKQLLRNVRIMDTTSMTGLMYGLGTAAAVYAAKQGLQGRDDKLDAEDIARGAFQLSNMTSVIPSFTDPVAQLLGLQDYKINQYGTKGGTTSLIPIPPMFPTLSRLAMAPIGYKHVVQGNWTKADINNIQATPLVGNALGFSYIFNEMKKDAGKQGTLAPLSEDEDPVSTPTKTHKTEIAPAPKPAATPSIPKSVKPVEANPLDKNQDGGVSGTLNAAIKAGGGQ